MTSNNKILIKNVYHMLAYALPALAGNGYTRVASEDFDHIHDLMASILITGLSHLYKRGLHHDYISRMRQFNNDAWPIKYFRNDSKQDFTSSQTGM